MNMKKTWKRFFSLDRHHAEGFTLVELIVVIAILAILGGVAVPAYSGYVEKANMAADQTLVSEVAHALALYYYANPNQDTSGYVILTTDGAEGDGSVGDAAMAASFGEGWRDSAVLKYDGWTDDGLMNYVLANKDSAPLIANSTFLTTATPKGLMNAVTNLTDAASSVIKNYAEKNPDQVEEKLKFVLGDKGEEFVQNLNATGVKNTDPEYTTVISNMLVGHYADVLNNSTVDDAMQNDLTGMMLMYAEVYAYCETISDTATMDVLNNYLAGTDNMDNLSIAGLNDCLTANTDDTFMNGFLTFTGTDDEPGQGSKDIQAALEIMGAVSHVAGTYTDKDSLSNPNLYESDSVAEQLDNYINAVKAVANLDTTGLGTVGNNTITVFVANDGTVSVVPSAAYLVSKDSNP